MISIQDRLKAKIKEDTGLTVAPDAKLIRNKLGWSAASAGRLKWYWMSPTTNQAGETISLVEYIIGSSEGMKELLKCDKIQYLHHAGQTELSTS